MKFSSILGLNARARLFSYRYNTPRGKKIARSKLLTKKMLSRAKIPTPKIYQVFREPKDVFHFNWNSLPDAFALKPSKGSGGEGIIVVRKKIENGSGWLTTQRKRLTADDLRFHTLDILEGAYSFGNLPDIAYLEEYVPRHRAFAKYAYLGTPDIRVIVFEGIPVMAMLRLPTLDSGGRANLHQGAIGVGIDIATGITTYAIWYDKPIRFKPNTKRKLNGIKIPEWNKVLEIAVQTQQVSGLGYVGVDMVLYPEKGPQVLELNSSPGLSIQLANRAGLRRRLERVEDLRVKSVEHGIKIAKALFAEAFSQKVIPEEQRTISVFEKVKILPFVGKTIEVEAKIDTGAWRTSIDHWLAAKLGLLNPENVLWNEEVRVRSGLGRQKRKVIGITFYLAGKKIETTASVTDRRHLRVPLIIGRRDIKDFVVRPTYKKRSKSGQD